MDKATSLSILSKVRAEKQGNEEFVSALHQMANNQIQADGLRDVRNLALATAGVGLGLRGLTGLVNLMRKPAKKTRSGPAELPLPYPVEADAAPDTVFKTAGSFLAGDMASTKGGMPWYGPSMLFAGLGGLAAGWKGMDYLLDKRREAERQRELENARQDFHDALLSQYDKPLDSPSGSVNVKPKLKKAGEESTMEKVGQELDRRFDQFSGLVEKQGIDWGNLAGGATGMYGMYAGLTGLLAGAVAYDKFKKRSRGAIIDKALQRRERRRFMQAPTEVYAVPEPVKVLPRVAPDEEAELLKASMAKIAAFAKQANPWQQDQAFMQGMGRNYNSYVRMFGQAKAQQVMNQRYSQWQQGRQVQQAAGAPSATGTIQQGQVTGAAPMPAPQAARPAAPAASRPVAPAAPRPAAPAAPRPAATNPNKQLQNSRFTSPDAARFLD